MRVKQGTAIWVGGLAMAASVGLGAEGNKLAEMPPKSAAPVSPALRTPAEPPAPAAPVVSPASPAAEVPLSLVSSIGILPGFKRGEILPEDERNPYANREVKKEKPAESGSEAAKIIKVLEKLQFRGIVRDATGKVKTMLLGDIAFTENRDLPQLLPSQVDQIYISKLTNREVEITWRTDAGKRVADGRRLVLKLDDRPKVEVVLPGQPDVKNDAKQRALLVAKPDQRE
jgi:hypothetical protein